MREAPFFFENKGSNLFGIIYEPDGDEPGKRNDCGIVFCSPFAEEKLWSHRVYVNMARILADKGYTAMRFDQRGHGDSEGEHEDMTVETHVDDVNTAVHVLKKNYNVKKVGVLGLRWGGTIAVLSALPSGADFLVLWEPIVKGAEYFQQCLRSNLATQLMIHRKVVMNREQLIQKLMDGTPVNIDGYLVSREFYVQATGINLLENPEIERIPVLVVRIRKGQAGKSPTDLQQLSHIYTSSNPDSAYREIQSELFWGELRTYFQRSASLFSETMSWIENLPIN